MRHQLSVRNFSCIEMADVEMSAMTFLIGPQASGKSVISKLSYFCLSATDELYTSMYVRDPLSAHKQKIADKFRSWFPSTGWGDKQFRIKFSAGEFNLEIARTRSRGKITSDVRIKYASFVEDLYNEYSIIINDSIDGLEAVPSNAARQAIDRQTRIAGEFTKHLRESNRSGLPSWQIFVPAGRSFFTSQYRTASTFSKFDALEPLLSEFGQLYGFVRDRGFPQPKTENAEAEQRIIRSPMIEKLLGGDVIIRKETAHLVARDGRSLPFSFLSSGQQELLPLLLVLQTFSFSPGVLTYIEEPEAHLFPESQSILLKYLVGLANSNHIPTDSEPVSKPRLFITTHSPYVLARLNNLLKAGQLASGVNNKKIISKVEKIVPREAWIEPSSLSAYAIEDGVVKSIIGEDGFVIADYLDRVSDDISTELGKLLQIEIDLGFGDEINGA